MSKDIYSLPALTPGRVFGPSSRCIYKLNHPVTVTAMVTESMRGRIRNRVKSGYTDLKIGHKQREALYAYRVAFDLPLLPMVMTHAHSDPQLASRGYSLVRLYNYTGVGRSWAREALLSVLKEAGPAAVLGLSEDLGRNKHSMLSWLRACEGELVNTEITPTAHIMGLRIHTEAACIIKAATKNHLTTAPEYIAAAERWLEALGKGVFTYEAAIRTYDY